MKRLDREVGAIAARAAPGALGFGLMNLESGEFWVRPGERPFPMQSVFKLPLGGRGAGGGRRRPAHARTRCCPEPTKELSPPLSPIADAWPGAHRPTRSRTLLIAAVGDSDNTAADLLMRRIGGPGRGHRLAAGQEGRRDPRRPLRARAAARRLRHGLLPAGLEGRGGLRAAMATVPPARRARPPCVAYMADPQDTATPARHARPFLRKLDGGELMSRASTAPAAEHHGRQPTRRRSGIKAGLPKGAAFAHKTGTSGTDQGLNGA